MQGYVTDLESILERLELFAEPPSMSIPKAAQAIAPTIESNRVFVVHGHNEAAKEAVARLVSSLELEPIILHEKPNNGKTIIEKFEQHSDVAFAIILLTADDVGAAKGEDESPRARQNVILELGYFVGRLGRAKVCPLYEKGVELPSDLSGVIYVELDAGGAWRFKLAKEMKAAGLSIDMNKV
jgi:predicted nucleotide-binding protein